MGSELNEASVPEQMSTDEVEKLARNTRRLLTISRWPVFLFIGVALLVFFVVVPAAITNAKVADIVTGAGAIIMGLTLIVGVGLLRRSASKYGFAIQKGEIDILHAGRHGFRDILFRIIIPVVVGLIAALGLVLSAESSGFHPQALPKLFVACGVALAFGTLAQAVQTHLWEFAFGSVAIFLATGMLAVSYQETQENVKNALFAWAMELSRRFDLTAWATGLIAVTLIVVGLSLMVRWRKYWRDVATEANEGQQ